MSKIFIGIDPDVDLNGVAVWNADKKEFMIIESMPLFKNDAKAGIYELLSFFASQQSNCKVIIDAGWLNKSNFHVAPKHSAFLSAQIGERTGANHQVGKIISQMCESIGLPYEFHKPTKSKLKYQEFRSLTKWQGTTNQDKRDAAMLVFGK